MMMTVRRVIVGMAVIMRVRYALIRTVRIDNRTARFDGPLHLIFDPSHDRVQSNCIAQIREHEWQVPSHFSGVAIHHSERGAHVRSEVNFIYYKEVRASDSRTTLAGDLIALGDVENVAPNIDKLRAERGGKIIAAALDEDQLQSRKRALEIGNRLQVHRGIFANGRMRAGTSLNSADAIGGKRPLPQQEFSVLLGVDVVGHDGEIVFWPEALAKAIDESRLSGANRTGDTDAKGAH